MSSRSRVEAGPGDSGESGKRLQVLLLDYEMAREDERVLTNVQAAMLSVGVALLAGLAALISSSCQFQTRGPGAEDCTQVPAVLLAATPLAPLSLFSYVVILGAVATVRSYYTRALEAEIQRAVPIELSALPGLPAASFVELTTEMASFRRGRPGYRAIAVLVLLCNGILFSGFSLYIVLALPRELAVPTATFYGACILLLATEASAESFRGRTFFRRLVHRYVDRGPVSILAEYPRRSAAGERSLGGYLLWPRPQDAIKAAFVPITFGLGALSSGETSGTELARAVGVWLILELLIYQARYQWNDIRGFFSDLEHTAGEDRRRLPGPATAAAARFRISGIVILVRLLVAAIIAVALPGLDLVVPLVVLTLLVFVLGVGYESLRAVENQPLARAGGPVAPTVVALWIVVGGGYVIRGLTGLALAVDLTGRPALLVATLVTLAAFGTAFVTLTWSLEATNFAWREGLCSLVWPKTELLGRQHVLTLARWLPASLTGADVEDLDHTIQDQDVTPGPELGAARPARADAGGLALWRPLRRRPSWSAPYVLATTVAGGAGAVVGLELADPATGAGATGLAALLGAVLAGLTVLVASPLRLAVAGAGFAALISGCWALGSDRPWLAAVPWIVVVGVHVGFGEQSWRSLKYPWDALSGAMAAWRLGLLRAAVGPAAWDQLTGTRAAPSVRPTVVSPVQVTVVPPVRAVEEPPGPGAAESPTERAVQSPR